MLSIECQIASSLLLTSLSLLLRDLRVICKENKKLAVVIYRRTSEGEYHVKYVRGASQCVEHVVSLFLPWPA
jgi:hypothetical protein